LRPGPTGGYYKRVGVFCKAKEITLAKALRTQRKTEARGRKQDVSRCK